MDIPERRQTITAFAFGAAKIGLPPRVFLYTIDQIAVMLDQSEASIKTGHLFFEGRSSGSRRNDLMIARNIAPVNEKPDWRVADREFVRWMRCKGFRYYNKGGFTS